MNSLRKIKMFYYLLRLIFEYPYSVGFNEYGNYLGESNIEKRIKELEEEGV